MSHKLFVGNLPNGITLEDLIIYFQSPKSGGGDLDAEACELNGSKATVVFEEEEALENVLQRTHEIDGTTLDISDEPHTAVSKQGYNIPSRFTGERSEQNTASSNPIVEKDKAYFGEVRTVIVSGLNPDTTDDTLTLFFENSRRSGGGVIEHFERWESDVAHITYKNAEVAAEVLKQPKRKLDRYMLHLKEKQPKLFLPEGKKKLYIENIASTTTRDGLLNYMEIVADAEMSDLIFGATIIML